jgi:hypothetical protein
VCGASRFLTGCKRPRLGLAIGTWVQVYPCDMESLLTTDACTMPTVDRPLRLAEFDALFSSAVRRVERLGGGVRMHLAGAPGLVDRVRDLTRRETACCSFFTFTMEGSDDDLTLDISVPPARQEILDALADRAVELSS